MISLSFLLERFDILGELHSNLFFYHDMDHHGPFKFFKTSSLS